MQLRHSNFSWTRCFLCLRLHRWCPNRQSHSWATSQGFTHHLRTSCRSWYHHQPQQVCFRTGLPRTPHRQARCHPSPWEISGNPWFPSTPISTPVTCLVNFYHRFQPHSQLMQPLHALLSKGKSKSQSITLTDTASTALNATLANASLIVSTFQRIFLGTCPRGEWCSEHFDFP